MSDMSIHLHVRRELVLKLRRKVILRIRGLQALYNILSILTIYNTLNPHFLLFILDKNVFINSISMISIFSSY